MPPAVEIRSLSYRYGDHVALNDLDLTVNAGEIFGLLGPNGSGKSTLFRILSTLVPLQQGDVSFFGARLSAQTLTDIRRQIGVVFQAPALDKMLTGYENLRHQGHLYGLSGAKLAQRIESNLAAVGMLDVADRRCDKLSGGQRRRIELAKAMLHHPKLLILDEPSTGLDPAARLEYWTALRQLRANGATILLTTHLMEEAEDCSRLAILDAGRTVAIDSPENLRSLVGGQVISLIARDPESLAQHLSQQLGIAAKTIDNEVRIESSEPELLLPKLIAVAGPSLLSISLSKPSMRDVFLHLTGKRFN